MTPTMLIRVATAALVGAMFLPAQSPAEGRRPAAKATASAAERAQVRLAEVMAMLQDDSLSPEQRAEATRKLEEVMAALAAANATPVAGQPSQPAGGVDAPREVVVVRSSRDGKSAQDSQSSSSSSSDSSSSGSSSSDSAKATDEQSDRGKAEAGKGKGRAKGMLVVPGMGAEATAPAPAQDPQPASSPAARFPKPPKAPKAPKAPKPPKAPRAPAPAAPPAEAPPAPPAEGSVFEVSSLEPGTFLLSTEPPEGMTEAVASEPVEPLVISESPGVLQFRVQSEGLQPLVIEGLGSDGARATLRAHVLELNRVKLDEARQALEVDLRGALDNARRDMELAQRETEVAQRAMVDEFARMKFDEAREALDVDLRGALLHARRDLAQAQRETQVVQRAMVEDKERMRRDAAAAPEADGEAREANRAFVLRARDRAAAERDVPPRRVERQNHEVRGQRPHTRAKDEDIRALIDEMRAEMREIRSLMQEMRAHAGAAPAAGDRLHYVDERRVETTTEAMDAEKDAHRAGRPVRLRWAREGTESTEPAPAQPIRLRWQRAAEAPKTQAVEEVVEVSTSPVSGDR